MAGGGGGGARRGGGRGGAPRAPPPPPPRRDLVLRGFLVNASNPKAVVFMLAVVPQFIDTARPLVGQYLLIAATLVAVDLVVMGGYTGLAAKLLRLLREPRQVRLVNRIFGGLFVGAALLLASFRRGF